MPTPTIDELTLADEPVHWTALGFTVADGCCQLGDVRMRFTDPSVTSHPPGIVGWSLRDVASTELDGLPTTISAHAAPAEMPAHPNGVLAIDHIVAMSPAFERSVAALQAAGLDLRRVREEPTPAGAPRQAFFRLGREILELVQEPDEVVRLADLRSVGGRTVPRASGASRCSSRISTAPSGCSARTPASRARRSSRGGGSPPCAAPPASRCRSR